ncbi:type I-F CRISPR-associated protein Csy3 [Zooshikella marina]|uniref:type I-F CRISPR-associated protein Csy3 n=1 Tax=Zooshikella ganghwensis TaxID=202772 RepID=UPI001BAEAC27|nr:type I-F CRISPR-associated protein Csy3 [Zooshikella ganghwensis]MBU2708751.1 type I-F CRISPR-associated protein Csy3 [Zooshikella ganghwensis]
MAVKTAGVLAFQRSLYATDAQFYSVLPHQQEKPVWVIRHGIRGTQNVNKATEKEFSNIQITDTAKLDPAAEKMKVVFDIKFFDLANSLFACAKGKKDKEKDTVKKFRATYDAFLTRAKDSHGLKEVVLRYVRNCTNGRWLWRNLTLASTATITVVKNDETEHGLSFDAVALSRKGFTDYTADELALAELFVANLQGYATDRFRVTALLDFGMPGVQVYPSQLYTSNKPKGFARPLYAVGAEEPVRTVEDVMHFQATRKMGQAALRDDKVANAIRTIDTWYPDYESIQRPIAIEPQGVSLELQERFRIKKASAFEIIQQIDELDPDSPNGMFMIASLIRGGVYSGE